MDSTSQVVLEPLPKDQASILDNLAQLYAHDFSEHVPLELGPNGRFEVSFGDKWWTTEDHFAFLIRTGKSLAGFALARKGSRVTGAPDVMDVAEFFVARGFRRKSVGTNAAHALFESFPGSWDVRVRKTNAAAKRFWSHAIATFVGRPVPSRDFSIEGVDWDVIPFAPQMRQGDV